MNIVEMNGGEKAPVDCDGCVVTIGAGPDRGSVSIDLEDHQSDVEQLVMVYVDAAGRLNLDGGAYAAVLTIPPRRYAMEEVTEEGEDGPVTFMAPVAQDCNPEAATVQLWGLPNITQENEE